jgi:hypothetical protein
VNLEVNGIAKNETKHSRRPLIVKKVPMVDGKERKTEKESDVRISEQ